MCRVTHSRLSHTQPFVTHSRLSHIAGCHTQPFVTHTAVSPPIHRWGVCFRPAGAPPSRKSSRGPCWARQRLGSSRGKVKKKKKTPSLTEALSHRSSLSRKPSLTEALSHGSSLSLKLSLTEALSHAPFAHTPARAFFPRDHTIPSSPIVCTHHNSFPLLSSSSFQCVYKRAAATKAAL